MQPSPLFTPRVSSPSQCETLPAKQWLPICPFPQPVVPTIQLSVSEFDSCKWIHTVFVLCSELPLLRWYWALVRMPSRPMAVDSNVLTSWIASLRSFSSRSVCFLFILLVASTVCRSRRRVPDRELWLCTNSATWDRASCRLSTTWLASSNSWKQSSALPWRRWRSSARPRAPSFARWPCRLCSSPFLLSISAAWSWKGRERYWPLRYTMV